MLWRSDEYTPKLLAMKMPVSSAYRPVLGREDVVGRVRDEDRMVTGMECAVLLDEVQQVGHLLEVGGNVRVVAGEVYVVEFGVDYLFDLSATRVQRQSA